MTTLIIFAVLFVAFLTAVVFSASFRQWVSDSLRALGLLIVYYFPAVSAWVRGVVTAILRMVGIYAIVIGAVAVFALILVIIAFIAGSPVFTGIAFTLALSLILLTWLPAGIILRLFRVNRAVIPQALKFFVAWVAFIGFVGMVLPDLFSFRTFLGIALVAFILLGVTTKINAIDKIIFPLVVVMCLTLAWKHFFPEDFRSSVRYAESWSKKLNTKKDRGSIDNETDAATTYGALLKDVDILYTKVGSGLAESSIDLKKGLIVKLVNHKNEVEIIDGQGFVQIQLAKQNGSFVNGKKYFIEAEFVQLASPRDIVPENDTLLPGRKKVLPSSPISTSVSAVTLYFGTQTFSLMNIGDETPWLQFPDCTNFGYKISSADYGYEIVFSDGSAYPGNSQTVIPFKEHPTFKVRAKKPNQFVNITVWRQ